jgi:hypothetical protein
MPFSLARAQLAALATPCAPAATISSLELALRAVKLAARFAAFAVSPRIVLPSG